MQAPSKTTKAASRARQDAKAELRRNLEIRLQRQLQTGADLLPSGQPLAATTGAATGMMMGAGGGVWAMPLLLINASACYQVVYRWVLQPYPQRSFLMDLHTMLNPQ